MTSVVLRTSSQRQKVSFDPHAVKINIDGNCWKNPGGSGGVGVRVDYGCDIDREPEVVEYRGYFETNNQRMELRACIFAHEWIEENTEGLSSTRFIILTDSSYVYGGYSWVIGWAQSGYATSVGRPIKNPDLWKDLMTLRRKLARSVRIEVKLIPRRSDEGAKEVDRVAKAAGRQPSHVDWGFKKGKIGRPKNNSKKPAQLYPAAGQTPIIRPYKSDMAAREIQLFKFEVWDDGKKLFFDKFEAYTDNAIGNELHRQNVYQVRMNDIPRYPQILEILWSRKEKDFVAQRTATP
jgi:ribonuclease HI